jgi:diguanylate cyclase (GGDEF)-like protein
MPPARTSFHELAHITEIAARAPQFVSALETVVWEIGRVFQIDVYALERVEEHWSVAAATPKAPPVSHAFLAQLTPPDSYTPAAHRDPAGRDWLAISLSTPWAQAIALLLPDDQIDSHDLLSDWARLTAFALGALHERDLRKKAEQLLGGGYSTLRRLSRLGTVDVVAQRVVDEVARLLTAGRVALALYRPAEDFLTIVATHGHPMSEVEQIRIQPGSWVIGHVYSKGRPVLVRDVRKVHGMAHERRGYRSSSFAAVPIFAGSTTVGVLTATDKRDNSSFSRQDFLALRTLSVVAGMALVASRSQSEAGRLAYAATVDALTGLLNRTSLDGRLHQEFERAKRAGNQLAVVMADVDDFKTINDTHGHQIGDAVLQVVGAIIRSAVRVFDVCARYGGDEFAILMPSTDHASAAACAERIRRRVSEYRGDPVAPMLPSLTMSVGVAVIEAGDTPAELIQRADRALYQAKAAGKNCVRVHTPAGHGRPAPASGLTRSTPDVER